MKAHAAGRHRGAARAGGEQAASDSRGDAGEEARSPFASGPGTKPERRSWPGQRMSRRGLKTVAGPGRARLVRAGSPCHLSWGCADILDPVLAQPAAAGAARRQALEIISPGLAVVTAGRQAKVSGRVYQAGLLLLCAGEQEWTAEGSASSRRPATMGEPVTANKFVLKHHQVEVDYTAGATPGIPALIYRDGPSAPKSFTASEVTTDQTGLGTLVSVALAASIDTGGERFGFFLPQLDVPRGQSAEFRTAGVYERFSGPDSIPHREPSWRCIELDGTAQTVIVEL